MDDNYLEGLSDNKPDDFLEEFTGDIEEPEEKVVKDFYFISEKPLRMYRYSNRILELDIKEKIIDAFIEQFKTFATRLNILYEKVKHAPRKSHYHKKLKEEMLQIESYLGLKNLESLYLYRHLLKMKKIAS